MVSCMGGSIEAAKREPPYALLVAVKISLGGQPLP